MTLNDILERVYELRNRKLYQQNKRAEDLEWWFSINVIETLLQSNLNTLNEERISEFWGIKVSSSCWIPDDWIDLMPILEDD